MKNISISLLFWVTTIGIDYLITNSFSLFLSILFFIFILFITLFFQSYKRIYLIIILLSTLHHLFFNYFHREISPTDISLFFTHMTETFESFFSIPSLFVSTAIYLLLSLLVLATIYQVKIKIYTLNIGIKSLLFILLIMLNSNSSMATKLLHSLYHFPLKKSSYIITEETPLYPEREANLTVLLLIGESMKYDSYVESKLKAQNFFYKKIYSGATNTDVAVPLLLNSKNNPLELTPNNESNLFRLAKKNHFRTSFISIQSEKSLQYISPYLQKSFIDYYKTYSKKERKEKFDFLLLEELQKIDFRQHNFIVLQQIGEHSPYRYFVGDKSTNPKKNYLKSVDYSFELYQKIYQKLLATKKPFLFIYTSDHGEFTGEGKRYGHNSFDEIIYEVPLFIISNIALPNYKNIKSHHHLSQYISYLLGYKKHLKLSNDNPIVNGTMLSREDGFITIKDAQ